MNLKQIPLFRYPYLAAIFGLSVLMMSLAADGSKVLAHGGEDHGDQKPKVESTGQGLVLRTSRMGDLEVTVKHPVIEPDGPVSGSLFVSKFSTNEPLDVPDPVFEIESSTGAITKAEIRKVDAPGTYAFTIPALPEGVYAIRLMASPNGKAGTVTFSDVKVAHQEAVDGSVENSWARTGITAILLLGAAALFAGLLYFAFRAVRARPLYEETVSA